MDPGLLQAWQQRIGGMCDGLAANAVATLVLVDTWRRGLLPQEKLVADLLRFKRLHLELAILGTCAGMNRGHLRRMNKTEMIKILMR